MPIGTLLLVWLDSDNLGVSSEVQFPVIHEDRETAADATLFAEPDQRTVAGQIPDFAGNLPGGPDVRAIQGVTVDGQSDRERGLAADIGF
jgi:hypothetical protein